MTETEKPLLLVTIGTDHHQFDRLIGWVDDWLADGGSEQMEAVIQHSTSPPPVHGKSAPYLPFDELQRLMGRAAVVVCHAGSTITECLAGGLVPVVVPRLRAFGEAVDDHQVKFARRLAGTGVIVCCESKEELSAALNRAVANPKTLSSVGSLSSPIGRAVPPGVRQAGEFLDSLLASRLAPDKPTKRSSAQSVPARVSTPLAPGDVTPAPCRVLFLGGFGRSGSTLVERMLGELPGVHAAGELAHLWQRGLIEDQLCSCGEAFSRCQFWQEVGSAAFGGWSTLDLPRVMALRDAVDRNRFIPQLAARWLRPRLRRDVERYASLYERLYGAILTVSGASVVVDSSKRASLGFCLRRSSRLDLRVVHVVRDSRGVANSWGRTVARPEVLGDNTFMPRYSALRSGMMWNTYNALFHLLHRVGVPTTLLRYEDVISAPAAALEQVADFAGIETDEDSLSFISDRHVTLSQAHTVAGNPMRFRIGRTELRTDEAWRSDLPGLRRRIVSAVTFPLRARYGYTQRAGR